MMQPTVLTNQHRNTAIIVAISGKKYLVIKLGKGKLTVQALTQQQISSQGYMISEYPPALAALSYLQHGAGVSDRAKQYLQKIAEGKYSGSLTL